MTRRDRCYLAGKRAWKLDYAQSARAWQILAGELEKMGEMPMPKFKHLLRAIRGATIAASSAKDPIAPSAPEKIPSTPCPMIHPFLPDPEKRAAADGESGRY